MTSEDALQGDRTTPGAAGPLDPDDPAAAFALEPCVVAPWLRRLASGQDSGTRTSTLAFTGAPLATFPLSSADDARAAVAHVRGAHRAWAARGARERTAVLLRGSDLLLERQSTVLDLLQMECGVARAAAVDEVAHAVGVVRHYGLRGTRYLRTRRASAVLASSRTRRRPAGVVGVLTGRTAPLAQLVDALAPALVAGNGVVLRPDPQCTLSALWLVTLLEEAGLPSGLVQVVAGDEHVVAALAAAVDHLVVRGADADARELAADAARRWSGVTALPDTQNSMYVAADADPSAAARVAVRACFTGAAGPGGRVERIVVHEDVADAFLAAFGEDVRGLRQGTGLDYTADVGSLPTEQDLTRVVAQVEDAIGGGARVLAGAVHRLDVAPLAYAPTVLDRVAPDARVRLEVTDGPVVVVDRVPDDAAAVALLGRDAVVPPARVSVVAGDVARARRIAVHVDAPTVTVAASGAAGAPASVEVAAGAGAGTGRLLGRAGVEAVTVPSTVVVRRGGSAVRGVLEGDGLDAALRADLVAVGLRVARALRIA
ncbi:succinate-semialdehyde dehydrogenase/glutarate-semialdehyde dehydrogenase [Sediminihabitans luteus]|uniref:Succinate-semialdehyde dehydrogenase/glutarate-semialdehyde dehydrogenase n=1 Tax=Sediminihabitans luteus TaxID=1138585 RepID=A0A2M9CZ32_9CELL|nr:aldehyde dehydrogenase family protein [Sediminihabitans luteus]PJJ77196.1 succinate-semialdehyde dehydrogenase/glutarate-semialdehyde dehydrogenase [Sediminihabitans luteus]